MASRTLTGRDWTARIEQHEGAGALSAFGVTSVVASFDFAQPLPATAFLPRDATGLHGGHPRHLGLVELGVPAIDQRWVAGAESMAFVETCGRPALLDALGLVAGTGSASLHLAGMGVALTVRQPNLDAASFDALLGRVLDQCATIGKQKPTWRVPRESCAVCGLLWSEPPPHLARMPLFECPRCGLVQHAGCAGTRAHTCTRRGCNMALVPSPRATAEAAIQTRCPELDGLTLSCPRCRNDALVDTDAAAARCASCDAVTPLDAGLVERWRRQLGALRAGGESQPPRWRLPELLFSLTLFAVLAGLILTLEWLGWLDGYSSAARPIATALLATPFAALLIWFHRRRGASTQLPLVRAVCPHSGTRHVQRRGRPLPCPVCAR